VLARKYFDGRMKELFVKIRDYQNKQIAILKASITCLKKKEKTNDFEENLTPSDEENDDVKILRSKIEDSEVVNKKNEDEDEEEEIGNQEVKNSIII